MRYLMIKLIICLMIMFSCVSCSSDDEIETTKTLCGVEYIESYYGAENIWFEHIYTSAEYDSWVSKNPINVEDNKWYQFKTINNLKQPEIGNSDNLNPFLHYCGNIYGDSVIVKVMGRDGAYGPISGIIYVSCKHHHKCNYHNI